MPGARLRPWLFLEVRGAACHIMVSTGLRTDYRLRAAVTANGLNYTLGVRALQKHIGTRFPGWRHQMETFSALLAFCAGNSPVTGEFPAQRPVARSFDVFFDLRLNQQLSKQWWFETPSRSLWRHCNEVEHCRCLLYEVHPLNYACGAPFFMMA